MNREIFGSVYKVKISLNKRSIDVAFENLVTVWLSSCASIRSFRVTAAHGSQGRPLATAATGTDSEAVPDLKTLLMEDTWYF